MRAILPAVLILSLTLATARAQEKLNLKDPRQRASYALGADIGLSLKRQQLDIDAKALAAGVTEALADRSRLTQDEIRRAVDAFQSSLTEKSQAREKESQARDQAFLAANAKQPGVITTASGLQYKILKSGSGRTPRATDAVRVHYTGKLADGTVFDSSFARGQPAEIRVTDVINGWTEALLMMKEGDKWQLVIPPGLAYGERGFGGKIGPNAALVYEIELLSIAKQQ